MIYLITRPIALLFAILLIVLKAPYKMALAVRDHRMRKNVKVAARAARDQQKAARAQKKAETV